VLRYADFRPDGVEADSLVALSPFSAHAPLSPRGVCTAHPDLDVIPRMLADANPADRVWHITGSRALTVRGWNGSGLTPPFDARLEPGTRLRLDDWGGMGFCDGQMHSTITWRFCLLDGPLAGYCIEAGMTYWDDHATYRGDPVEPVTGWTHDWRRNLRPPSQSHRLVGFRGTRQRP
jgi:hypothetical protein